MESQFLEEYEKLTNGMTEAKEGNYHFDVPFRIDTGPGLLLELGFTDFEMIWQKDLTAVRNAAVYVVIKGVR